MGCSVLQCHTQCDAMSYSARGRGADSVVCVAVSCSMLRYAAVCCSVLQCVAVSYSVCVRGATAVEVPPNCSVIQ